MFTRPSRPRFGGARDFLTFNKEKKRTMKKKILLPNNGFGVLALLALLVLIPGVPLVLTLWLVGLVAPSWVAIPCALLVAATALFSGVVKFEG